MELKDRENGSEKEKERQLKPKTEKTDLRRRKDDSGKTEDREN